MIIRLLYVWPWSNSIMFNTQYRWLQVLVGLGVAIAIALLPWRPLFAPANSPPAVTEEVRGVWLTNVASGVLFAPWGVERAIDKLAQLHFNTLYPVIWNRGKTFYPSSLARQVTGSDEELLLKLAHPGSDVLATLVERSHKRGLRAIAWFEYGFMVPANSELAKRHPDWLTRSQQSSTIVAQDEFNARRSDTQNSNVLQPAQAWLNPFHPEVRDFIKGLILEAIANYAVDGIQLDDHFGLPVEMGYDRFTAKLYQQERSGQLPPSNPRDPQWVGWRANKITEFVGDLNRSIKTIRPDCIVSLSPNSQSFSYQKYLQDWRTWVERGFIDELVLQVYRRDLNTFVGELAQPAVQFARSRIPTSVGILSGTVRTPAKIDQIQAQVRATRDRGFAGVSFFYWESLWGYIAPEAPQQRRNGFRALFSQPATIRKNGRIRERAIERL